MRSFEVLISSLKYYSVIFFKRLRNETFKWLLPDRFDVKNKHDIFFFRRGQQFKYLSRCVHLNYQGSVSPFHPNLKSHGLDEQHNTHELVWPFTMHANFPCEFFLPSLLMSVY